MDDQQYKIPAMPWIMLIVIFMVASCSNQNVTDVSFDQDIVVTVNGEPVSTQLFEQRLSLNRADVYSYFYKKYKISDPSGFWATQYGKEVPAEVIKKKVMDDCVEIKIQQILARDNGIMPDITYKAFLEDLKRENLRRKEVLAKDGVIYGPEQYTEKTYFEYVLSNMQIKLKTKLGQDTFHVSDDELKKFHESGKLKNASPTSIDFKEFKEQIRSEYVNEKYKELIKQKITQADIQINSKVYATIEIK